MKSGFVRNEEYYRYTFKNLHNGINGTKKELTKHKKNNDKKKIEAHEQQIKTYEKHLALKQKEYELYKERFK